MQAYYLGDAYMKDQDEAEGRAKGGVARAKALSPQRRREIGKSGADARWAMLPGPVLLATHGAADHPLQIGDIAIPCYVLEDEKRVLSQRGLQGGIGMSGSGGSRTGEQRLAVFFESLASKGIEIKDLSVRIRSPIRFRAPGIGKVTYGYEATILADICDVILAARKAGVLQKQQDHIAEQCEILVRGFARVGIIALVDEATGFQQDRAKDALARILEAFIAQELQPWVKTFPNDFYRELFRLRGLEFPNDSVKRPQYFGSLTNDIVYKRIAPHVLAELKKVTKRDEVGRPTHKYFQRLTTNVGYPKLREHLGSVVTIMKLSKDYPDFLEKLNIIHPPFNETLPLALEYDQDKDTGHGL